MNARTDDTVELMAQRVRFAVDANDNVESFMDKSIKLQRATTMQLERIVRRQNRALLLLVLVAACEAVDLVASLASAILHH